jgi:hypothetical protein
MNVNLSTPKITKIVVNLIENIPKEGKEAPKKSDLTTNVLSEKKENECNRILSHKYSLLKTKVKLVEKSEESKKIVEKLLQESKENSNLLNTHSQKKNLVLFSQLAEPYNKSKKEIRNTIREANEYLEIQENTKIIYEDKLQTRFSAYERK